MGERRLGSEEPPPSRGTQLSQLGGSRQAPVIHLPMVGRWLPPLVEVSALCSWGSARTGTGLWGDARSVHVAGETGMTAPITSRALTSLGLDVLYSASV